MCNNNVVTTLLFLFLALPISTAFAGEKIRTGALSGHVTHGSYSGSDLREGILSQTFNLSYIPTFEYGMGLKIGNSQLKRKLSLTDINGNSFAGTAFFTPKKGNGSFFGGMVSLLSVRSDDPNSNDTLIPYLSLIYKSPDFRTYIDFGYARTGYNDTTANQITLTGGFSIFKDWVWSHARVYYIDLSETVQRKNNTFAFEQKLIYYLLPGKASLSLYGMVGRRIYAYDPDLHASYNLSDIQSGSAGVSANYNLSKRVSLYGDATYELYKNNDIEFYENNKIADRYSVIYSTAGASVTF